MTYFPDTFGDYKNSVRAATTGDISLASPGSSIDSVSMATGDRVLVKQQATASENGIYIWNGAASAMTRARDADDNLELTSGMMQYVEEGGTNGTKFFVMVTPDPIVVDSTSIAFAELSGPAGGATVPTGSVTDFAGSSAPTGWLVCDGSVVAQATYPDLYSVIGNTYDTGGEGAGNFRLPDARGRSTIAPDSGAGRVSANNTLADTSGAETHTLTTSELASHTHANTASASSDSAGTPSGSISSDSAGTPSGSISSDSAGTPSGTIGSGGSHDHRTFNSAILREGRNAPTGGDGTFAKVTGSSGTSYNPFTNTAGSHSHSFTGSALSAHSHTFTGSALANHSHTFTGSALATHSHTITMTNAAEGSDSAHNNMQPYIVFNKIIKY